VNLDLLDFDLAASALGASTTLGSGFGVSGRISPPHPESPRTPRLRPTMTIACRGDESGSSPRRLIKVLLRLFDTLVKKTHDTVALVTRAPTVGATDEGRTRGAGSNHDGEADSFADVKPPPVLERILNIRGITSLKFLFSMISEDRTVSRDE
jgi:hypothetical protein